MLYRLFFSGLLFCTLATTGQTPNKWIHFDWHGETIFGKYYPKVAMSIPLKVEKLPYNFCAQFDLGATTTLIYGNSFRPYSKKYPSVMQHLDTTGNPHYHNGEKSYFLKGLNIQLDQTKYPNRDIAFIEHFGDPIPDDSVETKSQKLIGTIAPDLFQGQVLIIDFVHNRLTTATQVPKQYAKANFVSAVMRRGRMKIPLKIGDSTAYVLFDTGNCMADLLLDKATINLFTNTNETPVEELNGNSWGQSIALYSKSMQEPVYLNNKKLQISKAIYTDLDSDVQFNKEEKIIGLIGPVLFSQNIVIIDYKNNRFGVL